MVLGGGAEQPTGPPARKVLNDKKFLILSKKINVLVPRKW
jgi:hypothetical protein